MLNRRKQHYEHLDNAILAFESESDSEADEQDDDKHISEITSYNNGQAFDILPPTYESIDWQQFLLVVGQPGTGKSYVLKRAIQKFSSDSWKIFGATPTGFLATECKDCFPDDIDSDTIHSSF